MKSHIVWLILGLFLVAVALAAVGPGHLSWPWGVEAAASKKTITLPTASPTRTLTPSPTITATLPLTPTVTETPTPTFTPTPQPVHVPLVLKFRRGLDLLNGGFESGAFLPGWQDSGRLTRDVTREQAHSGSFAALLGNPNYNSRGGCPVGEATVYQVMDVPHSGHPTLRFWYLIQSYDLIDFDYFAAYVSLWPDGPSERVWLDGSVHWISENLWSSGWRVAVVSLDAYLGRTITIRLSNVMTNADGWYNTWTIVDDVELEERP